MEKMKAVWKTIIIAVLALALGLVLGACNNRPATNNTQNVGVAHEESLGTEWLQYKQLEDGTYEVTGYVGTSKNVQIPSTYQGQAVTAIGARSFIRCGELTTITIPNSVTSIGFGAFEGCSGLTSITIPDSVTSIGFGAFVGCSGLTSIEVAKGNSVYHSVDNCIVETASKTLVLGCQVSRIPADGSVTTIGDAAFYDCSGLTTIFIPESVTSIGFGAFKGCSALTSISIPNSVTSIGSYAFNGCSGLTSVSIPNSVTSMGYSAFEGCSGLAAFAIPEGVTKIETRTFFGCSGLTSIVIPVAVTKIENRAFVGCSGLTSIEVAKGNSVYHSVDNCIVETASKTLVLGCRNSRIPTDGRVTSIGYSAFEGCSEMTSVSIPTKVTSIGTQAFQRCDGLTTLFIPRRVTAIGGAAFAGCDGLTSIEVAKENTVYHSEGNCLIETASKTLVLGCCNSRIPEDGSVTSIGEYAFFENGGLKSLVIPDGVRSIGAYAFYECTAMTAVSIPVSLQSIEHYAFTRCDLLESITYQGTRAQWHAIDKNSSWRRKSSDFVVHCTDGDTEGLEYALLANGTYEVEKYSGESAQVQVPPTCQGKAVTAIGNTAFYGNSTLESVIISQGVTSIGSWAFRGCVWLYAITLPESIVEIGDYAFADCPQLTTITYQGTRAQWDAIRKDGSWNYNSGYMRVECIDDADPEDECGTEGLEYTLLADGTYEVTGYTGESEQVQIPTSHRWKSVSSIGKRAFYGCSMTNVVIPSSVKNIDYLAFADCGALTQLLLPEGLFFIQERAFSGCTGLTSVSIPSSVRLVGCQAFEDCDSLEVSYYYNALYLGNADNPYFMLYKAESTSINQCAIHADAKVVYSYAFSKCKKLTKVSIPDGVVCVGDMAFAGCDSLNYSTYDNAKYLGNDKNPYVVLIGVTNTSIKECTIHDATRTLCDWAFGYCKNLTSLVIPDSVTSIGYGAFYMCKGLSSIAIGRGIDYLESGVFSSANRLSAIRVAAGNEVYYSVDNCLIEKASKTLVLGCRNSRIPTDGSVASIGDYAFYERSGSDISIPEGVTSIGNGAFGECSYLTEISIPASVVSLGDKAFEGCSSLNGITYQGTRAQWDAIRKGMNWSNNTGDFVLHCTNYDSEGFQFTLLADGTYEVADYTGARDRVWIPTGYDGEVVTSIGDMAFYNNSGLISTVVPTYVTHIGQWAFRGCCRLTSITIPDGVVSIGSYAFAECGSLTITYQGTRAQWDAIRKDGGWSYGTEVDVRCQREDLK